MAIISLRAYNREIESLIERGQHEQAIFHCRHILQYFPKHIDTYRLLGKTYLESQRYGDAADILQRVLSSIPDDFVSHVGLSIIREDEGNLNDAIWHMERAFETQPSNSAIQSELRRLRNKRDGYDAPKVRLTRGALARMYMKGDLFPQAIAELRAALAEDPKRVDLQILLGQCYLRADQRVEAAETCSIVLHKLPNALEANRILEQILATTERTEEARGCRDRVQALDPYYAHTTAIRPDTALVPDEAVVLEKGTWQPGRPSGQPGTQPDWAASLGVKVDDIAPTRQDVPDWLSDAVPQSEPPSEPVEEAVEEPAAAEASADDLIPDWLKDAGWEPSHAESEQAELPAEPAAGLEELPAVEAEIPEWLQAIAPAEEGGEPAAFGELESEPADMDWLAEPEPGAAEEIASSPQPEAELDLGDIQAPAEVPDWLLELGDEQAQQPTQPAAVEHPEEIPDWLADLSPADQIVQEEQAQNEPVAQSEGESIEPAALPDWLRDIEPEAEIEPATPADNIETPGEEGDEWAFEFTGPSEPDTPVAESLPADAGEIPDWLAQMSAESPAEQPFPEPAEGDAGKEPWDLEAAPAEELPDWMKEIEQEYEMEEPIKDEESEETVAGLPEESQEEQPAQAQESGPAAAPFAMEADEDAAFAWLESLAAKQGAREDELLLSPEQRQETPPDWVSESKPEEEAPYPAVQPGVTAHLEFPEEEGIESTGEEIPEWLKEIQARTQAEVTPEVEDTGIPAVTPAFFEEELEEEPADLVSEAEAGVEKETEAETAELPDWLRELQAEPPPAEEMEEAPLEAVGAEHFQIEEPEPDAQAAALPDWLTEIEPEAEPEAPAPVETGEYEAEAANIPDWLSELEGEAELVLPDSLEGAETEVGAVEEPGLSAETAGLPDWLQELETEIEHEAPAAPEAAEAGLEEGAALQEAEAGVEHEGEAEPAILPDWLQNAAAEAAPEGEPSFWPEEPPIIEGDTRPSTGKLRQLQELADQPAPEEILSPAEAEELPDWLVEMAEEAAIDELPTSEMEADEEFEQLQAAEAPEAEELPAAEEPVVLPEWIEEEAPALEAAASEEEIEAVEVPEGFELPAEELETDLEPAAEELEMPAEAGQAQDEAPAADEDAAFAWLESLAAKQGAKEEELLLEPEERAERPPDWIKKVLDTGELTPPEPVEPGLPAFIEARTNAVEAPEEEEMVLLEEPGIEQEETLQPVEEAEAVSAGESFAESIDAAEIEEPAEEIAAEVALVEQMFQSGAPVEEVKEEVPELPTWLQDLEQPAPEEEPGWTPPEETPTLPVEVEVIDLNTASLKDLERLPGVGFIRAQALIAYREANGPFSHIDELSLVEGFDADTIAGIRQLVKIEAPAPAVEAFPPSVSAVSSEDAQVTLLQARNELVQEMNKSALQKYLGLIESEELLEDVVHDLHEALIRNPKDVDFWQALGDAELRAGHIQEALNAYTRAEELLR